MKSQIFQRSRSVVLGLAFGLITISVYAHGEDQPGPNGGHVRMPGGFHTEALLKANALEVYLLDIQFQNPTTKNSSLAAKWKSKKSEKDLNCLAREIKFTCELPKNFNAKSGSLELIAKREGMSGGVAKYALPLKAWSKVTNKANAQKEDAHEAHH